MDSTTSNGTESTDIDEDAQEENVKSPGSETNSEAFDIQSPDLEITSPESAKSVRGPLVECEALFLQQQDIPHKLDTQLPPRHRSDSADDDPQSVIHVPSGFHNFKESAGTHESPVGLQQTARVASPSTPEAAVVGPSDKVRQSSRFASRRC